MDEELAPSRVRRDDAESARTVEPLDRATRHRELLPGLAPPATASELRAGARSALLASSSSPSSPPCSHGSRSDVERPAPSRSRAFLDPALLELLLRRLLAQLLRLLRTLHRIPLGWCALDAAVATGSGTASPARTSASRAARRARRAREGEMPMVERPVPTRVLDRPGHRLTPDRRSRGITCTAGCTQARCGSRRGGTQSLGGIRPRSTRPAIVAQITTAHPPA